MIELIFCYHGGYCSVTNNWANYLTVVSEMFERCVVASYSGLFVVFI